MALDSLSWILGTGKRTEHKGREEKGNEMEGTEEKGEEKERDGQEIFQVSARGKAGSSIKILCIDHIVYTICSVHIIFKYKPSASRCLFESRLWRVSLFKAKNYQAPLL